MRNKVKYLKVVAEGFQSLHDQTVFRLDNTGLNLIKGINGSGKSTTFNAILWCEYGLNLKKSITTWEENRTKKFRGTRVVVDRTDGEYDYRIARHLKFKGTTCGLAGGDRLMIFKKPIDEDSFTDKHLLGDGLHKADMQLMINEQLGVNEKTFMNSLFFGQKLKSLIQADNKDKRELFEQLFDVAFVDVAKEKAKTENDKLVSQLSKHENTIDSSKELLEAAIERKKEQETTLSNFDKDKKARIKIAADAVTTGNLKVDNLEDDYNKLLEDKNKYNFEELEKLKKTLQTQKKALDTATKSYDSAKKDVDSAADELDKSKKKALEIKSKMDNIEETCPTCKQDIKKSTIDTIKKNLLADAKAEGKVQEAIKKKQAGWDKVFKIADANKKKAEKDVTATEKSIEKFSDDTAEFARLEANIENKKSNLEDAKKELIVLKDKLTKEKEVKKPNIDIKATETKIEDFKLAIDSAEKSMKLGLKRLEKVKWWLTKGFGASGLKAYVFNAMLSRLNTFAHAYASKLGFRVEFTIDMSKASKPFQTLIYKGEQIKFYEDLSGGQQQRVDICIAFAMHDLISYNTDVNILVMDEVFEGLDNEGVEIVFELIREKSDTKSVYLITHSDLIDSLNSKSFTFALDENENTYIKS